jgi:hypothetical protein
MQARHQLRQKVLGRMLLLVLPVLCVCAQSLRWQRRVTADKQQEQCLRL